MKEMKPRKMGLKVGDLDPPASPQLTPTFLSRSFTTYPFLKQNNEREF